MVFLLFDSADPYVYDVSDDLVAWHTIDCCALVGFFRDLHPKLVEEPGSEKRVNKSINDAFTAWTRTFLSKYVTVNDIDAVRLPNDGETGVRLYELKRPSEIPLADWTPYKEDRANFEALEVIREGLLSRGYDVDIRVIVYDPNRRHDCYEHELVGMTQAEVEGRATYYGDVRKGSRVRESPQEYKLPWRHRE